MTGTMDSINDDNVSSSIVDLVAVVIILLASGSSMARHIRLQVQCLRNIKYGGGLVVVVVVEWKYYLSAFITSVVLLHGSIASRVHLACILALFCYSCVQS